MEVRQVSVYDDAAPMQGKALYVVLDIDERLATLFHPMTLDEFVLERRDVWHNGRLKVRGYDTSTSASDLLWPENLSGLKFDASNLADRLLKKVRECAGFNRSVPVRTCVRVISELKGISVKEAQELVGSVNVSNSVSVSSKDTARFVVHLKLPKYTGRQGTIIEVMRSLKEPTMTEIIEACRKKLKTTMKLERVVTFYVNELVRQNMCDVQGEYKVPESRKAAKKPAATTEAKPKAVAAKKAEAKPAKKTAAAVAKTTEASKRAPKNGSYELTAGQEPEKFKGQRAIIVKVMKAGVKQVDKIIEKCTAAGLTTKEGVTVDWAVRAHLRTMIKEGQAKLIAETA